MNQKQASSKIGLLDLEINFMSKILFVFMVIIAFLIVCANGFYPNWLLMFFRFILLLCSIIPISLRVNLDMGKIYYSYNIATDKSIPETIPRNSTIPEELGRVQYLLSDKTGTLTQNEMLFKKLAMEYCMFGEDNVEDMKKLLEDNCSVHDTPCSDIFNDSKHHNGEVTQKGKKKRRD